MAAATLHGVAAAFLFLSMGVHAGTPKKPVIPTRDILRAYSNAEKELLERQIAQRRAFLKQELGLDLSKEKRPLVEWDPMAEPFATRSWLMLNLNTESWLRLQKNQDEQGQPLL